MARDRQRDDDARERQLSGSLKGVMKRLPDIEREVVKLRMGLTDGHPKNLSETARQLNLTVPEAKQIEQRAFERIREVVPLKSLQRFLQD